MIWAEVTYANVLSHMPTDVLTSYNAWLVANPDRADRLATITANTVREFRDAIKSNPVNVVYDDEDYLPQSCIRHCENIIIFTLGMEMGLTMDEQGNSSRVAADIFLRMIPQGKWNTTTNDDADLPSPRYEVPTASGGRVLAMLVALLVGAATARGGWIKPDGAPTYDTQIATTFTPSAYTITTATLFGHLYGINAALATKATEAFVTNAIAQATSGVVDADARLLATSASYTAASAIAGLGARLSVGGGILTGPLTMTTNLLTVGSIILGTNAPVTNWPSGASQWSFSAASTNLNMAGTNDIINVRQIIGEDTSFWINMDENGGLLDSSVNSEWRVVRGLTVGSTLNVPSIALGTNAAVNDWPASGGGISAAEAGTIATNVVTASALPGVSATNNALWLAPTNGGNGTINLIDINVPVTNFFALSVWDGSLLWNSHAIMDEGGIIEQAALPLPLPGCAILPVDPATSNCWIGSSGLYESYAITSNMPINLLISNSIRRGYYPIKILTTNAITFGTNFNRIGSAWTATGTNIVVVFPSQLDAMWDYKGQAQ